jgi:outer membrane protein TolC
MIRFVRDNWLKEMVLQMRAGAFFLAVLSLSLLVTIGGCSTTRFKERADKEAYSIIEEKSPDVPNMDPEFTIEEDPLPELDGLPQITESDPAMGEFSDAEVGARVIGLEQILSLAVNHNRTYQANKESVYLAALGLTLDRHQYTPIFSGSLGGSYNRTTRDVQEHTAVSALAGASPQIVRELGALTGTPGDLLSRYSQLVNEAVTVTGLSEPDTEIRNERSVRGRTGFGVDLLMKGGGRIAVDITSNFLRYLTGDPRVDASSALVGSISQPLLRGAGSKVAAEQLTQAERDVLYALRDFTDYRKEFTVRIASDFYNVLEQRDAVRNNYLSYTTFQTSAERDRALVAEGRKRRSDLGRVTQAELNAENSWTNTVRQYRQSMDRFKITLGLPVDTPIVLDDAELERLKEVGLQHWEIDPDDAAKVALASRLDLYTAQDVLEDAQRKVVVASNSLLPDVNLLVSGQVDSVPGNRYQELDFERARWGAGLDVELPFNRKSERNAYRSALIRLARTEREYELAVDEAKLQVLDAWRALEQARQTYDIRLIGVQINQERVEEQQLLAELGRGDALDLVDAQNDLTQARNDLTNALVAHTIARLALWRDMGILFIKENGQWEDIRDDIST